jgi:hypothetical protein
LFSSSTKNRWTQQINWSDTNPQTDELIDFFTQVTLTYKNTELLLIRS